MKSCPTITARIFLAGDMAEIRRICREYCDTFGLCVTVTPTCYIYTGGSEEGAEVALRNYPRFPKDGIALRTQAHILAMLLREGLGESVMMQTPETTFWWSGHGDT